MWVSRIFETLLETQLEFLKHFIKPIDKTKTFSHGCDILDYVKVFGRVLLDDLSCPAIMITCVRKWMKKVIITHANIKT